MIKNSISIPLGTIKRKNTLETFYRVEQFQYLLVRLKARYIQHPSELEAISIPLGTIKSAMQKLVLILIQLISIPLGTIKSI